MKNEHPCVFGDGDATLCVTRNGFRLYIGQIEIKHAERISISVFRGMSFPLIEVEFSTDTILTEEEIRVCRTIPWIKVTHQV
jgi:hypothetical protein